MALLDESFGWQVCDRGYEPITIKPKKGKHPETVLSGELSPGIHIVPKGKRFRTKYPLTHHSSLYLDFAALDGSAEACAAFAGSFGLLTCGNDPGGEPLSYWQRQIQKMGQTIRLWQINPMALGAGDKGEIKVGETDVVLIPMPPDGQLAMRVRPKHLLGGMELQLAAAVAVGVILKHCKNCNQLFEIGPGRKRSHAEFCSSKCQTDYNNAKKLQRRVTR